jgi:type II secretory pathway component PulM
MDLTKREKTFVIGGIGLLVVLLMLQLVLRPAMERMSTLRRVVATKRQTLAELRGKSLEYRKLKTEVDTLRQAIEKQEGGPQVLSTVERIRQTCDLSDNVSSLKPTTVAIDDQYQETVVEIQLERITMKKLVRFLSELESVEVSGGIRSLEIRRTDRAEGGLRVIVKIAAVSRVG